MVAMNALNLMHLVKMTSIYGYFFFRIPLKKKKSILNKNSRFY